MASTSSPVGVLLTDTSRVSAGIPAAMSAALNASRSGIGAPLAAVVNTVLTVSDSRSVAVGVVGCGLGSAEGLPGVVPAGGEPARGKSCAGFPVDGASPVAVAREGESAVGGYPSEHAERPESVSSPAVAQISQLRLVPLLPRRSCGNHPLLFTLQFCHVGLERRA